MDAIFKMAAYKIGRSDHQSLRIWSDKLTARRRKGIIIIIITRYDYDVSQTGH
jgi:hypothetical protein